MKLSMALKFFRPESKLEVIAMIALTPPGLLTGAYLAFYLRFGYFAPSPLDLARAACLIQ